MLLGVAEGNDGQYVEVVGDAEEQLDLVQRAGKADPVGFAVFTISCFLLCLTPNALVLIGLRVVQAAGGASPTGSAPCCRTRRW